MTPVFKWSLIGITVFDLGTTKRVCLWQDSPPQHRVNPGRIARLYGPPILGRRGLEVHVLHPRSFLSAKEQPWSSRPPRRKLSCPKPNRKLPSRTSSHRSQMSTLDLSGRGLSKTTAGPTTGVRVPGTMLVCSSAKSY